MSKHTPGPWYACCNKNTGGDEECHCGYIFDPGDKTIAQIFHNTKSLKGYEPLEGEISLEEKNANARLIAAAPDLLSVLRWYLLHYGNAGGAEAVIAKAEGIRI